MEGQERKKSNTTKSKKGLKTEVNDSLENLDNSNQGMSEQQKQKMKLLEEALQIIEDQERGTTAQPHETNVSALTQHKAPLNIQKIIEERGNSPNSQGSN